MDRKKKRLKRIKRTTEKKLKKSHCEKIGWKPLTEEERENAVVELFKLAAENSNVERLGRDR